MYRNIILAIAAASCAPAVAPTVDGLPNFYQVDPGIYRSAQPTTLAQWQTLHDTFHVRHVLKLDFTSEGADDLAAQAGIEVVYVPLQPAGDQDIWDETKGMFAVPDQARLDYGLSRVTTATEDDAWLVHCSHGQDRTGLFVGELRVVRDGWDKDRAFREMLAGGYHPELIGLDSAWIWFRNPDAPKMEKLP
jgi:uncharacterized protein YdhG (YjbR/CyaY superfamily)